MPDGTDDTTRATKQGPIRQIVQPFIDVWQAPRALWGVNLGYLIEGVVYFGMLMYLAMHFSDFVFQGVEHADEHSHANVTILTAGLTISMFFLGFIPDKWGVRFALIASFVLMTFGRALMAAAPTVLGLEPAGLWSPLHIVTVGGILLIVIGYGMYQPAAYAAVRQFTTPKTAAMGFAMLYALMNLGSFLASSAVFVRDEDFLGWGITGAYWVFTGLSVLALVVTVVFLSKRTVQRAIAKAKAETAAIEEAEKASKSSKNADRPTEVETLKASVDSDRRTVPAHLWIAVLVGLVVIYLTTSAPLNAYLVSVFAAVWFAACFIPVSARWLAKHPLSNGKFFFFIFALIPVQTLFTYNWLILPQYISRSFDGWIGEYFEFASNANPILIFFAVPIITAMTQKANVYNMMIAGTFIMAAPAFLLVLGPHAWTLGAYIVIMTIGEAMWQPRFLQYAAEIAPEGQTGQYMGVAQLPWFLTKMLVPWLYSGWALSRYCPAEGEQNTEVMWLVFACIAMISTVLLVIARPWVGKDFDTALH